MLTANVLGGYSKESSRKARRLNVRQSSANEGEAMNDGRQICGRFFLKIFFWESFESFDGVRQSREACNRSTMVYV